MFYSQSCVSIVSQQICESRDTLKRVKFIYAQNCNNKQKDIKPEKIIRGPKNDSRMMNVSIDHIRI